MKTRNIYPIDTEVIVIKCRKKVIARIHVSDDTLTIDTPRDDYSYDYSGLGAKNVIDKLMGLADSPGGYK